MSKNPKVAKIDESICIGCAKCLNVCPFDAILGANKQMHVVLEELCIGCDLCIPPCPVDAISLINVELPLSSQERAQGAKKRFKAKKLRLAQIEKQKIAHDVNIIENMQNLITESIKRARQKTSEKFPWNSHES